MVRGGQGRDEKELLGSAACIIWPLIMALLYLVVFLVWSFARWLLS